jgi:hypothetical protein
LVRVDPELPSQLGDGPLAPDRRQNATFARESCRLPDQRPRRAADFDYTVRQAQSRQTMGIPVGPDSSKIIAELVMSAVD